MDLLHLHNCASTIIGNDLVRGVSGGEKKRVTVAEGLLTEARFLALDEISTGLDSAVTFDIVKRLRSRATEQGLTVVVSLLQPTPETFALFDQVILMREGEVVYHGSRNVLPRYLRQVLGLSPPTEDEARAAMGDTQGEQQGAATLSKDLADWLLQFLSDPAALRARERPSASSTRELATAEVEAAGGARQHFPTSTSELAEAWRDSTEFSALMGCEGATPPPLALKGTYALQLYGARGHAHSFFKHLGFLLERQFKLMYRNHLYMRSRVASAAIMSIILGGLYYNRTPYQGGTFAGTFLNSLMMMGFSNMSEMAAAVENKFIAYRHASKGIFPGASYVLSSAILHVPVAVVECFVFTGIIYGMTGMHGFYLSYFFPVFLFDLVMRNLLVFFTLQAKNIQAAQAMPLPM